MHMTLLHCPQFFPALFSCYNTYNAEAHRGLIRVSILQTYATQLQKSQQPKEKMGKRPE